MSAHCPGIQNLRHTFKTPSKACDGGCRSNERQGWTDVTVVRHFLITFDHRTQTLQSVHEFANSAEAVAAYSAAEAAHRNVDNLEIVLVSADSIETIHTTHGHYFSGAVKPTSRWLQA